MAEKIAVREQGLTGIINELKGYGYECEAGPLENAEPFKRLEEIAAAETGVTAEDLAALDAEFDFGLALVLLKDGYKVARAGWNGKGMWVHMQVPDEHSKMQHPYFYIHPVDGKLRPWNPTTTDLLAEDWMVVA